MRAVLPSYHYGDYLGAVLPGWLQVLAAAAITVVTAPDDVETIAVAAAFGVGLVVTDIWTRDGALLNKAAALDQAFGIAPGFREPPAVDEVCLALDADVYPFGRFPSSREIRPEVIYACARYRCDTAQDLDAHLAGRTRREQLDLIPPKVRGESYVTIANTSANAAASAARCLGYFQLFRYRPGLAFGSHTSAGKYDLDFRKQFPRTRALMDFYVLHLGDQNRANWRGRVLPRWKEA